MGLVEAIVYGIVQGLTEWLPISSTAHLRIVPSLLGWPDPGASFTAVIQLGTMLAVLIYFGKDLGRALGAWFGSLFGKGKDTPEARLGWAVFWGSWPIVIAGFVFREQIKSESVRSLWVIVTTLFVMGIVMLIAERVASKTRGVEDVRVKDGIWVGVFQALALIPGMSRSGSTISGALFAGFDRPAAARFSFLLSVPSIVAAGIFELLEERDHILNEALMPTLVATFVSFVVGYASIAWLMKFLQKRGIGVFVAYRFALAALLAGLLLTGHLEPTSGIVVQSDQEAPTAAP